MRLFDDTPEAIAEFKELMADPAARQAFVEARARAAQTGAPTRYAHVLRAVAETAWAIRPAYLALIVDLLAFRVAGGRFDDATLAARTADRRGSGAGSSPTVAVVPVSGVIVPKAGGMHEISGGTSVDAMRAAIRGAAADPDVRAMVLDVDSPGGMTDGVPELAAEIRALRRQLPVYALANTEAASAAYWLASQATEVWATPSSRVGSVGVYAVHETKPTEEGVEHTIVSAGRYKTEANPYEPLSDEGRARMQSVVDQYYRMFLTDVAVGRQVDAAAVAEGYGEGRVLLASEAAEAGMVDRVGTFDELMTTVIDRHVRGVAPGGRIAAEAERREVAAQIAAADLRAAARQNLEGDPGLPGDADAGRPDPSDVDQPGEQRVAADAPNSDLPSEWEAVLKTADLLLDEGR